MVLGPEVEAVCVLGRSDDWRATSDALGFEGGRAALARLPQCEHFGPDGERRKVLQRCAKHLLADLPQGLPAVAVGDEPTYALLGNRDHPSHYHRGLWRRGVGGRRVFVLESGSPRFASDAARCARTLARRAPEPLRSLKVLVDPLAASASTLSAWLSGHPGPWAFDVESYDVAAHPSRPGVAVDACHPDYRLRGVAVAWSEDEGVWFDFLALESGPEAWRPLLDPVFGSAALKVAHNGHFDEDGLVVGRWVSRVANRAGDSMLEWLALSDGRHAGLSLERLVVDVLGQDQWWEEFDKSEMRAAPIERVAAAAVRDAGYSLWLHCHARDLMSRGEYWDGQ